MHENWIVKDLVGKIVDIAEEEDASKVTVVRLKLGAFSPLSPDQVRAYFEHMTEGTVAEGARLEIETSDDPTDPLAQQVLLDSIEVEEKEPTPAT